MLIIWFQYAGTTSTSAGRPRSPNFHKSNALKTMRQRPKLQGTLLAKAARDYQLVDALVPEPGDIVLPKPRYSGFFNTPLYSLLRSRGIVIWLYGHRHQRRVESTLRDGFFLEQFRRGAWKTPPIRPAPYFAQKAACSGSSPLRLGQAPR
ncbi:isochorismatase family protein [Shigella flexneri]